MFLPDELIAEILSFLSVKTIMQLKCVSKSWNILISNPAFIEKHLKKSSQNPHLTLLSRNNNRYLVLPIPFHRLMENSLIFGRNDNSYYLKYGCHIAGSCNGLMCLFTKFLDKPHQYYSIYLWNPSTRKISAKLGSFHCRIPQDHSNSHLELFKFAFGYDDSTKTYKVVAYRVEENKDSVKPKIEVNVFNFGGNGWKNIQSFPLIPLNWLDDSDTSLNNGMHLSGTINWLAIHEYFYSLYKYESISNVKQFVIVSLDLSTETYKQLLLPQGFDEVPCFQPVLKVLMESLCFSHDSKKSEFVLWQMKEYGVQESWTKLFKISYQSLQFGDAFQMVCIYKNGDIVIIANQFGQSAMIYNLSDKIMDYIRITNYIEWFYHANDYVESLVAIP